MLKKVFHNESVAIMHDTAIAAAAAKTTLMEIVKQTKLLGDGLLIASPGTKAGAVNPSVQYLLEISQALAAIAAECEKIYQVTPPAPPPTHKL